MKPSKNIPAAPFKFSIICVSSKVYIIFNIICMPKVHHKDFSPPVSLCAIRSLFITFSIYPSRLMFILISHWVVVVTVAVCGCFLCVTQEKKSWARERDTNEWTRSNWTVPNWAKGFSIISSRRSVFDMHTDREYKITLCFTQYACHLPRHNR